MPALKVTTRAIEKSIEKRSEAQKATRLYKTVPDYLTAKIDALGKEIANMREPLVSPIEDALRGVNGKAERHAITLFTEVESIARQAESLLDARGVTQKNRVGAVVEHRPGGPSANSYKYAAATTTVRLVRVGDGWRFDRANRSEVYPKQPELFRLTISEAARDDIMRAALDGIAVAGPALCDAAA